MNIAGYWTGNFEGTNQGGLSLTLDQKGELIAGHASMHEPTLGTYQYKVNGEMGKPIKFRLVPMPESFHLELGFVDVICKIDEHDQLVGKWNSSIGTNGVFSARRYSDTEAAAEKKARKHVFISYSHSDKQFVDELLVHLKPIEQAGHIDAWSDQRIIAGSLWKKEIEEALSRAHIAILMVSAHFMASDFVANNELPALLKRAESDGVRILPLILRPCRFSRDPNLHIFQAVNDPNSPLAAMQNYERDQYYDQLAAEVENTQ